MGTPKEQRPPGSAASEDVAACVRQLNYTVGELARVYGAAAVVVALTEVMGCESCAMDSVERGLSIRALMERIRVSR